MLEIGAMVVYGKTGVCTVEGQCEKELVRNQKRLYYILKPFGSPNSTIFVPAEDNKVFVLTQNEKLQLKCRLYQVEGELPEHFVKINQSCIANIKMIQRFDASYSGTLKVFFKNGHSDYVSRRRMKIVRERMGL